MSLNKQDSAPRTRRAAPNCFGFNPSVEELNEERIGILLGVRPHQRLCVWGPHVSASMRCPGSTVWISVRDSQQSSGTSSRVSVLSCRQGWGPRLGRKISGRCSPIRGGKRSLLPKVLRSSLPVFSSAKDLRKRLFRVASGARSSVSFSKMEVHPSQPPEVATMSINLSTGALVPLRSLFGIDRASCSTILSTVLSPLWRLGD